MGPMGRTRGALAGNLGQQGIFKEAVRLKRQALNEKQKTLGTKHPDTLQSLVHLARDLRSPCKFEEAGRLYQQTLEARQKVLGRKYL